MDIIGIKQVANIVTNELNDIARDLKNENIIDSDILFIGTDDSMEYERYVLGEYDIYKQGRITPMLFSQTSFNQERNDYLLYNATYEITLYGFFEDKSDLIKIFNFYTNRENTSNRTDFMGDYRIDKAIDAINFTEDTYPDDGSVNEDGLPSMRIIGFLNFAWIVLGGIFTSDNVELYIDDVRIPYSSYSLTGDKRTISSQNITTLGIDKFYSTVNSYSVNISLPLLDNQKIIELYNDISNTKYNKKYKLNIKIKNGASYILDWEDYVIMVNGMISDVRPSTLEFTINLGRAPQTMEFYLNKERVPVLDYTYTFQPQGQSTIKLGSEETKTINTSSALSISASFPLTYNGTDNTQIKNLFADIHTRNIHNIYEVRLKYGDIVDETYFMTLTGDNSHQVIHNPFGEFSVIFTEVDIEDELDG